MSESTSAVRLHRVSRVPAERFSRAFVAPLTLLAHLVEAEIPDSP